MADRQNSNSFTLTNNKTGETSMPKPVILPLTPVLV
jgi:hypothetical protein